MGWDACTADPSAVIRWFECHPGLGSWLQGVFTAFGIVAAIAVPWAIHLHQLRIARAPHKKALARLILALGDAYVESGVLEAIGNEKAGKVSADISGVVARNLSDTYRGLINAEARIGQLIAKINFEDPAEAEAISNFQKLLIDQRGLMEKESRMLTLYPNSVGVVESSLSTGQWLGREVAPRAQELMQRLQSQLK